MSPTTILIVLLAVLVAVAFAFFQYLFKVNQRSRKDWILFGLRFLSVFGLLLLLINPVIKRRLYETEKTPLAVVLDNSSSVKELKADAISQEIFKELLSDKRLAAKFNVRPYTFDSEFESGSAVDFTGKQSNFELVSKNLKSIHRNKSFPTILLSDGNQTQGNDYLYTFSDANKVYPIVLGDTTAFNDLRITQVNVNKYAFSKNKFPAEFFLQYSGNKSLSANFTIRQGSGIVAREKVTFSPDNKSAVINVLLPASKVGLQLYKAVLESGLSEKNTYNNQKNFAVEILDQRSEIALVSAVSHPDLGALKRSIETNSQRRVTLIKQSELVDFQRFNVVILYQPTHAFKPVYERIEKLRINSFTITGNATDFSFLAQQQSKFNFRMSSQREEYSAIFNKQFNLFAQENIDFENFPPLSHPFGNFESKANLQLLLKSGIRNLETGNPMLAFYENQGQREAFLFGEGIWKWRLQSHVTDKNFEKFDRFTDRIVQFLASDNLRKSLVVNHERFYNSGEPISISAQYFNKNYDFDEKARLSITVTNLATKQQKRYDLLKSNSDFKANLDGLTAGKYAFSVRELNSNTVYNAGFEVLDFDIEKQFVNPDSNKLQQLASRTRAAVFFPDQKEKLIRTLLENPEYQMIQKEIVKKIPLVDSLWLLILIISALALEWFIRKYHGLL